MDQLYDHRSTLDNADMEYDDVMAKLNASLKRSASVQSSTSSTGGGNNNERRHLEGGNIRFGTANHNSQTANVTGLYDVNVSDYDIADQLPSVEEARMNALTTTSKTNRTSNSSKRSIFDVVVDDDYDDYEDPYKNFIRSPEQEQEVRERRRRNAWYRFAFFFLVAAVIGIIVGCVLGFNAGEEVVKLETEAKQNGSSPSSISPNGIIKPKPITNAPSAIVPIAPVQEQPTADDSPIAVPSAPVSLPKLAPISDTFNPTPQPTSHPYVHEVMKFLAHNHIVDQMDFTNTATFQYKTAMWIAYEDGARLTLPTTEGDTEWFTFIERYILVLFSFTTGVTSWSYQYNFLSSSSICEWNIDVTTVSANDIAIGVLCNSDGRVSSIKIAQNNLQGTLISELGHLGKLEYLALNHNALKGSIPTQLAKLSTLSYLALHYNVMTGVLPSWLGDFSNLQVLGLGNNKFSGSIPSEWSQLSNLVTLGLDDNSLDGSLGVLQGMTSIQRLFLDNNLFQDQLNSIQWEFMSNLHELDLSDNTLSGAIPSELLNLSKLRILDIGKNSITGKLPDFDVMPALNFMGLQGNNITGTIPKSMGLLANVTHLDLSGNNLVGQIPHQLSSLITLEYLSLSNNKNLDPGQIPTFIRFLTNLRDLSFMSCNRVSSLTPSLFSNMNQLVLLELDHNLLTGEVPSELGEIKSLSYLLLSGNRLTGTIPREVQLLPQLDILLLDNNNFEGNLDVLCNERTEGPELMGADCLKTNNPQPHECSCCNICCHSGEPDEDTRCHDKVYFGQIDPVWEYSFQRREYQFADQSFGGWNLSAGQASGDDETMLDPGNSTLDGNNLTR
jgi:Leucine-rich repeat (LRR) protein